MVQLQVQQFDVQKQRKTHQENKAKHLAQKRKKAMWDKGMSSDFMIFWWAGSFRRQPGLT